MHCIHPHTVVRNEAMETSGRRRCKVSDSRGSDRSHRVRITEQNPAEVILCPLYRGHLPGDIQYGANAARGSTVYESSDLQSLDEIARAEEIEADLDAAAPELKAASSDCGGGSQAHKLVREIKDRLNQSEVQMRRLREERDDAVNELMNLSGKITNCTALAEEQANILERQSETISKLEAKIQVLEKAKQEMRHDYKKKIQILEDSNQHSRAEKEEYRAKIQGLEDINQHLRAEKEAYTTKIQSLEDNNQRLRAEGEEHRDVMIGEYGC